MDARGACLLCRLCFLCRLVNPPTQQLLLSPQLASSETLQEPREHDEYRTVLMAEGACVLRAKGASEERRKLWDRNLDHALRAK